jgi:uncharacterized oxidoreductase
MTDVIHVDAAVLTDAVAASFAAAGCDSREARLIADGLVEANLFGHDSHGVSLVPHYLDNLRDGLARAGQSVRVTADHGAIIGLDGIPLPRRTRDALAAAGRMVGADAFDRAFA